MHDSELVKLEGVRKEYGSRAGGIRGENFLALKGVDLAISAGEYLGIIGKSGSGKTTLLNMITGIDRPSSGTVWFGGERIDGLGESDLARFRGRRVGIVFQFFQLMPTLSVLENVMLPMDFLGAIPARDRMERAKTLLERIGIADQMHKLPQSLSGGQQQRAAIARALANDPALLVADEPTGNLDTATAGAIWELFAGLVEEGKTLVVVSHDPDLSSRVARSIVIRDGFVEGGGHA
ncbi:MAG TPA: ABC transporter ATP-binding protein [Treponemataceae bacterium]|nr:ABC transporter ATP-binding protein [Treponemataceae bacterium]HPS43396.1 ABC transporter ATP-binding protein [Treponemataceae bacterium]